MSDKSQIEWTDATWNPVTGCTKVSSGCKHCYAERVFPRVYGIAPHRGNPEATGRAFTDVRCHPERLDRPLHQRKPRRIFVNSMSDLFHEDVPFEFIRDVFITMGMAQQHSFQVLTKRPERMRQLLLDEGFSDYVIGCWGDEGPELDWPLPNVWLGVSVEDQTTGDERIPLLLDTPAAVRWISAEPLLGPIDLTNIEHPNFSIRADVLGGVDSRGRGWGDDIQPGPMLDWVVVGGESGPKARPMHPEWVRALRDQCTSAGVPFYFKQWGQWLPGKDAHALGIIPAYEHHPWGLCQPAMGRVGKKAAGRLLDGVLHDAYPEAEA